MTTKKLNMNVTAFPALVGKLSHSVQFLKVLSLGLLALLLILALGITSILGKEPIVVVTDVQSKILQTTGLPKAEVQIEEAVRSYLNLRYWWDSKSVAGQLQKSESFIAPFSIKAFRKATESVAKFSTDKGVSQRLYPHQIKIDLSKKVVEILGDRVTSIQGVLAAGVLRLGLDFEYGARTLENPWGIYITKEREEGL